jgi:ABC-type transport system substrate-binding protein
MVLLTNPDEVGAPQFAYWTFSARANSTFRDARIRRAISMMLDRDLFIDTYYETQQFRDAGLPIDALWNSHNYAGMPNWTDPKANNKDLGEGGKHFLLNQAEARKLVNAAGFQTVKETIHTRATRAQSLPTEIFVQMAQDGGIFEMKTNVMDEPTYRDYQASKGHGYDGMYIQTNGGHNEEAWFINLFTPAGKYSVDGEKAIPQITDKVVRIRREVDDKARVTQLKDLQRDLAMDMTNMILPGYAIGFTLHWPWLKNYDTFTVGDLGPGWSSSRVYTEYWYDKSAQT